MTISEAELLRAACCVAGADGTVSDAELTLLRTLKDRAGVGEASFQAMLDRARTDSNYFEDVLEIIRPDAEDVVRTLIRIAKADGEVSLNERVIIGTLAQRLGMDRARVDRMLAEDDPG